MIYPKWRYHTYKEATLAKSAEHDESLGEGWADNPSVFGRDTANADTSKVVIPEPEIISTPVAITKRKRGAATA